MKIPKEQFCEAYRAIAYDENIYNSLLDIAAEEKSEKIEHFVDSFKSSYALIRLLESLVEDKKHLIEELLTDGCVKITTSSGDVVRIYDPETLYDYFEVNYERL